MKLIKIVFLLISIVLIQSCVTPKNSIFWVSGFKTACTAGVGNQQCLNIYKGKDINHPTWEVFYATIDGFVFEEGVLKKIEVKEEKLKNVPADASSIRYTMVKELKKQVDYRLLVGGNWILNQLNDHPINRSIQLPEMEIKLKEMQISGTGGCNRYSGQIQNLTTHRIQFGNISSTEKACIKNTIEQDYFEALSAVNTYQTKGDHLIFYNAAGKKVLSYMKKVALPAKQQLHDIWVATQIEGHPTDQMSSKPTLEINLTEMKFFGNNSCNEYSGKIKEASATQIIFGAMATTKKMCAKMDVASSFNNALPKVVSYQLKGLNLILLDANGEGIITFLKVD